MAANGMNGSKQNGDINPSSPLVVPLQINGKEFEKTEHTFDVVNPASGKVIWEAASASKQDAIKAVEAAQAAFPAWSKTKPSKRRNIINKAADIMESRAKELAEYMMMEMGAGPAFVEGFIVPTSVEMLRDVAGRIATVNSYVPISNVEGTSSIVFKEPYGVVLGISPWNAPYILGCRAVVYALAAGNTTILKASELAPRSHWAIGSVFKEAGLPDGCLNVLVHRPQDAVEITNTLIEHPDVKKLNFTGSTAVGSIIASIAGKNLKPCLMELGGKASAIVLPDADLKRAATGCALGAFVNSGQVCMSTERILVHSSIVSAFSEELKLAIDTIFGAHVPAPVLVTSAGVAKNHKLISQALDKGAKILTGDINAKESSDTRMRPIVIKGIQKDMDLYYQESFGPTVSLIPVDSEEEAITLANDTEYGLSSAVFTESLITGLRVAKQIESGAVHINSMSVHDEPSLPHGGVKKSGWGRFNESQGLEEFLRSKTVTWQDA